jgi:amidase
MELSPSRRAVMAGMGAAVAIAASGIGSKDASADEDAYHTAGDQIKALADRKISSRELVDAAITRIEKLDPKINAVVVRDFERARSAAKAADEALAKGERRPLLGLPMTVKESFAVAGLTTTRGDPRDQNWKAGVDGLAVQRLRAAGAVILGKTNVPLALADFQSYNDIYGATNNPWDLSRTPGGSSGGAAATLAAGFVPLELGSDIGGSLRVPAHFCGVYAHKPTLDLIPLRNSGPPDIPALPGRGDLAVYGPMSRSAADLALELDVVAGPDEMAEGVGYKLALPPPRHDKLADFRVLVLDEHPLCPTAASIRGALNGLADRLEKTGCRIVRGSPKLPDLARTSRIYNELLAAVYSLDLTPQDRARIDAAARVLSPEDQSLAAYRLRGISVGHPEWIRASRVRSRLRGGWLNLFEDVDVVLCPVTPTPAFPHDHSPKFARQIDVDGTRIPYDDQLAWAGIATLNGLPATSAPIGRSDTGLPIGIQIVGGYLQDRTTIAFAGMIEREFGGFTPPPDFA